MEMITYPIISIVFFCICIWAYRRGLKDGLALKDNKPIENIKGPIQAINEVVQEHKGKEVETKAIKYLSNLLSFDGTPQEEIVDD